MQRCRRRVGVQGRVWGEGMLVRKQGAQCRWHVRLERDALIVYYRVYYCFFFNDTATTEIYTLSLHDALPIWGRCRNENWAKKSGALLQREMVSEKSRGAAATRTGAV